MGNCFGCSSSGQLLALAASEGDLSEVRTLLRQSSSLVTPLHYAASRGHNQIVELLLENGAEVDGRNFWGQTALMRACHRGHWEVVQTLLLFRSNVTRADYLSGKTALHFAAFGGYIRCIRLLAAGFLSSASYRATIHYMDVYEGSSNNGPDSSSDIEQDHFALSSFVNKVAAGGVTALHLAALTGHYDCVHLLLDLNADVSAVGASFNSIGARSTPLHFAACGGSFECCQAKSFFLEALVN